MPDSPPVSVLMPLYNARRFVGAAVRSVLRQSWANLELIVYDDESSDGSLDAVREAAGGDERVTILEGTHAGIGAVRGGCLRAARGEFLANLDADDEALPGRLEAQVAYFKEHPEVVAVGTQSVLVDEDGDVLGHSDQPLGHDDIEAQLWKGLGSVIMHSTVMMRRQAVVACGGYDERLGVSEDLDLYLRLLDHGRLANLSDRLNLVRRHCRSVSAVGNLIEAENSREDIVRRALRRKGRADEEVSVEYPPHPESAAEWHAKWAFRALRNGYPATARKHALRAVRANPLRLWGWRAVLHVVPKAGVVGERINTFQRIGDTTD